jgi:hypothetical protein
LHSYRAFTILAYSQDDLFPTLTRRPENHRFHSRRRRRHLRGLPTFNLATVDRDPSNSNSGDRTCRTPIVSPAEWRSI